MHQNTGNKYAETHGKSKTSEYKAWQDMKYRCYNPNNKDYPNYGGRGIAVCDRWLESFDNFLEDMGRKPGIKYSLDKIDNDGNYEPGNCRWATQKEQGYNKSTTKLTETDICKIKELFNSGRYTKISITNMFGVSSAHISDIIHNRARNNSAFHMKDLFK